MSRGSLAFAGTLIVSFVPRNFSGKPFSVKKKTPFSRPFYREKYGVLVISCALRWTVNEHDRWLTSISLSRRILANPLIFTTVVKEGGEPREGVCLSSAPFEIRLFNRRIKVRTNGRCKTPPFSSLYPARAPLKGTDDWHVRMGMHACRRVSYRLFLFDLEMKSKWSLHVHVLIKFIYTKEKTILFILR